MKPHIRLATLILLGAMPLAGIGADYGGTSPGSTGSPSGSTTSPSGQGGMTGTSPSGTPGSAAQPDTGQTAQVPAQFRRLDKDKDGMISKSEAKRSKDLAGRFDEVDSDRDGKVSLSEWQSGQKGTGAAGVPGESREPQSQPSGGSSSTPGSSGTDSSGMGSPR